MRRLTQLGWAPWAVISTSAVVRGSYHLYQGIGAFFGRCFLRQRDAGQGQTRQNGAANECRFPG